jgi:TPR repeat protein
MRWRLDIGIVALLVAAGVSPGARGDDAAIPPVVERLQTLAARGDSDAALQLGVIYDTGKGVGQDFGRAMQWYRQAAVAGNAFAAFDLGALYDAGRGAARDAGEALHWYRFAAERGLGRAAYALGVMTEAGDGVAPDPIGAARWYRRALSGGVEAARDRLAALSAAREQAAAAPFKNPRREFSVAVTRWRINGIDGNDVAAYAALQAAAADGLPLAQYDLAYSYEHGIGAGLDLALAYAWYRAAAASDGSPALKAAAAVNRDRLGRHLSDEERRTADLASGDISGGHPDARR